jgi:hypothetical protein
MCNRYETPEEREIERVWRVGAISQAGGGMKSCFHVAEGFHPTGGERCGLQP